MKDVVNALPWIGLFTGVVALFLRGGPKGRLDWANQVVPALLAAVLAFGASTLVEGDVRTALVFVAFAAVVGGAVSSVAQMAGTSETGAVIAALGITAFVVSVRSPGVEVHSIARLGGIVCGLGVSSLGFLSSPTNRIGVTLTGFVFVAGTLALIAQIGYAQDVRQSASLLTWSSLLAVGVLWGANTAFRDKGRAVGTALALAALALLSWMVFSSYLGERPVGLVCVVAAAAAAVNAWAVPPDRNSIASWGISAIVWLGVATYAFSTAFGLGMAAAALVGVAAAFVLGRRDLLPATGIIVGLAVYRLFRENNDELVQAFDIGQHYAMIGFLLGIVVLVAATDAVQRRRGAKWFGAEGGIVGLIAAAVVVGACAFFGTKGAIGLMVGLAVAPMVGQLGGARSAWAFPAAAVLQSAVLIAYRPLAYDMTLDRDAKLRLLIWLAAGAAALYIALRLLGRPKKVATDA